MLATAPGADATSGSPEEDPDAAKAIQEIKDGMMDFFPWKDQILQRTDMFAPASEGRYFSFDDLKTWVSKFAESHDEEATRKAWSESRKRQCSRVASLCCGLSYACSFSSAIQCPRPFQSRIRLTDVAVAVATGPQSWCHFAEFVPVRWQS